MDNKNTESSSSSTDPTPSTTTAATTLTGGDNARDHHHNNPLRHLHRFSHKISKPSHSHPTFDSHPLLHHHHPQQQNQNQPNQNQNQQNQQNQLNNTNNQPPVYNINKNDFRDVVQKLTGAPPPPSISSPPPPPPPPPQQVPVIQAPKPPSSRLQRIRPPPLSQISNRPPSLLGGPSFPTPSSPLPPLPSCHAAAESPITAYMRFLHGSGETNNTGFTQIGSLNSPKFNELAAGGGGEQQMIAPPVVPFGCFPSPRSPGTLFSPTGSGQFVFPQLPVSPRIPAAPSPK